MVKKTELSEENDERTDLEGQHDHLSPENKIKTYKGRGW